MIYSGEIALGSSKEKKKDKTKQNKYYLNAGKYE